MKMYNKSIVSVCALFFSSAVLAFECPPAGGPYSLTGHNADGTSCTYTSKQTFKLDLNGKKLVKPHCPEPIVTDPHYRLIECHHDAMKSKCVCSTVRNH